MGQLQITWYSLGITHWGSYYIGQTVPVMNHTKPNTVWRGQWCHFDQNRGKGWNQIKWDSFLARVLLQTPLISILFIFFKMGMWNYKHVLVLHPPLSSPSPLQFLGLLWLPCPPPPSPQSPKRVEKKKMGWTIEREWSKEHGLGLRWEEGNDDILPISYAIFIKRNKRKK